MKRVLALLFILSTGSIFAENVIIAVINNSAITFKSLENSLLNAISKEHKADIVHQRINDILQLQKAKELNIRSEIIHEIILRGKGCGVICIGNDGKTKGKK